MTTTMDGDIAARAALEARLLGKRAGLKAKGGIDPVARDGALALSPAQHRIWFFDQLVEDRSTNNIVEAERILGSLSTEALARAVDVVVARHEPLRWRFAVEEGVPRTVPAERVPALVVRQVAGTKAADRGRDRADAGRRGRRAALRPDGGGAIPGGTLRLRAGRRRLRPRHPPHRRRRMVDTCPAGRACGSLCGGCRWPCARPADACRPIRRLCGVAERGACRRAVGRGGGALPAAAGRCADVRRASLRGTGACGPAARDRAPDA